MRQNLAILILLSLLALAGYGDSGTDNSKELELKELALKEKELVKVKHGVSLAILRFSGGRIKAAAGG